MKKIILYFSFIIIHTSLVFGQSSAQWIFDDSILPEVHIIIDQDSLDQILDFDNRDSDYEYPATFIFTKGTEVDTVENIGFRLRGNTSRSSQKKSFKVSFNTFEQGRQYHGLDKMNLNGEHNDPSIMRAKVSWDVFERIGLPAPRSNHIRLFINEEYFGLYMNVEHIDDEFVKDRFGSDAGNLYKNLYPADLSYISENSEDYKWSPNWTDRRVYDLKTNTEEDDYSDLASLISFLEASSMSKFKKEIEDYLNVDGVLRWMAVDILTGNWDNYWYNQNNFYLYNDPESGRFEFIPYDYDNTLGIDFLGPDWGTRDINDWGPSGANRPLTNRILEVEEYRNRLNFYIERIIEEAFNEEFLFAEIDRLKALTEDAAEEDVYRTLDYNYGIGEYHSSFNSSLGGHVKYGLKPFISTRIESALNQISNQDITPIIRSVTSSLSNSENGIQLSIFAEVIDESVESVVAIIIHSETEQIELKDDGEGIDIEAGDHIYSGEMLLASDFGTATFSVLAEDNQQKSGRFPNNPDRFVSISSIPSVSSVIINEFMADNETGIQDSSGKFEDWIELYNPTDDPINLKSYFLTDDFSTPEKWAFPDTTILPSEFLLIWADNDEEEGILHTNFGLSNDGEELGLYVKNGAELFIADTLTFGVQSNDVSFGRNGDGSDSFVFFSPPTPGASNGIINPTEEELASPFGIQLFQNYPNPFNPETTISFRLNKPSEVTLEVFSIEGRLVQTLANSRFNSGSHSIRFDASSLSSGMYFYRLTSNNQSLTKRLVLIK